MAGNRAGRESVGQASLTSSLSSGQETRPHTSFLPWGAFKTMQPCLTQLHVGPSNYLTGAGAGPEERCVAEGMTDGGKSP